MNENGVLVKMYGLSSGKCSKKRPAVCRSSVRPVLELVDAAAQYAESVLKEKYLEKRLSMRDIAREFSSSKTHIRDLLLKHNIPLRDPSKYHKYHSRSYGKRFLNGRTVDFKKELRTIETIKKMHAEGMTARGIAL